MCVSVRGGSVTSGQNVTAWSTCHMVYSMSHTDEMSQGGRTVTSGQNVTSWKTCHMVDRMSHNDELSKGGQDHKRGKVLPVEEKSHKGLNAQVDNMSQNNLFFTTGQQLGEILHKRI